jgi:hypothetical protein
MALVILEIIDLVTRYIVYGVSYIIFLRNREGAALIGVLFISHKMINEYQNFDLCGLLKYQLKNKSNYPFNFATLVIWLVIYFMNSLPLNNNVIWRENEIICKQIYIHSNNLGKCDQEYEIFFKILIENFGIAILVKKLEVGSSSGVVETKKKEEK